MENIQEILRQVETLVESVNDKEFKKIAYSQLLSRLLDDLDDKGALNVKTGAKTNKKKTKTKHEKKAKGNSKVGPKGLLEELVEEDFFEQPKSGSDILEELEERGRHLKPTDLTRPLQALVHSKELRRKKMKSSDGKQSWHWSNW